MKIIVALASLVLVADYAFAQQPTIAKLETSAPLIFYEQINESLDKGDEKGALQKFDHVIDFFKQQGRMSELPENYMGMALSLAFSKYYKESIKFHKKALRAHRRYKRDQSCDEIKMNMALAYQLAGKKHKADRIMNRL